jgi:hypothetical protein
MTEQRKRIYARARRAIDRGEVEKGRTLVRFAGELGRVRYGPEIAHLP